MNHNERDLKRNSIANVVDIGGLSKESLIGKLQKDSVRLNKYADMILAD